MINLSDQLHAATESGILADASEIKDGKKKQSDINAELLAAIDNMLPLIYAAL